MNNKKNILFIIDTMGGGGAEKAFLEIVNRLDRFIFNISILLYTKTGEHLDKLPSHIKQYSIYHTQPNSLLSRIIRKVRHISKFDIWKAKWILRNQQFDTIVSFMEGPPAMIHAHILNKAQRNITWLHTDITKFTWDKKYISFNQKIKFFNNVDLITACGKDIIDNLMLIYNIHTPTIIIPNIVNKEHITHLSIQETIEKQKFTLCGVGRLIECKHWERAIRAIALLKEQAIDCDLWIIGQGPLCSQLKDLTTSLNIDNNVKFLGFKQNPYPYFKAADFSIITSDIEGMPITLIESSILQTPVITTKCSHVTKEYSSTTGLDVDFTAESIVEKIKFLLSNPQIMEHIQTKSELFADEFTPEKIINKITSIL